jgi:hypothetical protein
MFIQRLAENLDRKGFFVFEICSFEVDAYMYEYVQKTFFCAVAELNGVFAMIKLES